MCHWGFFYKTNVVEGERISIILGNVILPKLFGLCFTCESWDSKLEERVEALPCEERVGAIVCWFLVCDPFAAQRAKGEEEYP
jgi:hypothetical protein